MKKNINHKGGGTHGKASSNKGHFKAGEKLDLRIIDGIRQSNVLEWMEEILYNELPKHGHRYQKQLLEGEFRPIIAVVPTPEPTVEEDRAGFILSKEDKVKWAALPNAEEKEEFKIEKANEWIRKQKAINAAADFNNKTKLQQYGQELALAESDANKNSAIFSKILENMTRTSRNLVRNVSSFDSFEDSDAGVKVEEVIGDEHVSHLTDDFSVRSFDKKGSALFEEAKIDNNWVALVHFAMRTHLLSNTTDPIVRAAELEALKKHIESFKQGRFEYNEFIIKWENRVRSAEACGITWSHIDKIRMLVASLNTTVFASFLSNWNNIDVRSGWTMDLEFIKNKIKTYYSSVDPAIVIAAQRGPGVEVSFGVNEKASVGGPKKCPLCDGEGRNYHPPHKCPLYQDWRSIEHQKSFWSKKSREEKIRAIEGVRDSLARRALEGRESSGKSESSAGHKGASVSETKAEPKATKGTVAMPKKEEKTNLCVTWTVSEAFVKDHSLLYPTCEPIDLESLSPEETNSKHADELGLVVISKKLPLGVGPHEVDMVLDTATESNVAPPSAHDVVMNRRSDPVYLKGVGGRVLVPYVGDIVFGRTRLIGDDTQLFLLSQFQMGDRYKIVDEGRDHLVLEGRQGTVHHGEKWHFYRDFDRYQDQLLHCTVTKSELMAAFSVSSSESSLLNREMKLQELPNETLLDDAQRKSLDLVESIHQTQNHASWQALLRTVEAEDGPGCHAEHRLGISKENILLWKEYRSDLCEGCLLGKIKEHPRQKSKKQLNYGIGEAGGADLMFVEQAAGKPKQPFLLHVDLASKTKFVAELRNKTSDQLEEAYGKIVATHEFYDHHLKHIYFDRESGIVSIRDQLLQEFKMQCHLKAASQKVGVAEVEIKFTKESARATKAGAQAILGVEFPGQWNKDLLHDVISTQNGLVRPGATISPIEQFTGIKPDRLRNQRVKWGELVVAKKPKDRSLISDLKNRGEYGVVVRRYADGSGVVKVWLPSSGRYGDRFKVRRVRNHPEWVLKKIAAIGSNTIIGFEPDIDREFLLNEDGYSTSDSESTSDTSYDSDEEGMQRDSVELERMYRQEVAQPLQFIIADNAPGVLQEYEPEPEEEVEEEEVEPVPDHWNDEPIADVPEVQQPVEERRYPQRLRQPSQVFRDSYTFGVEELPEESVFAVTIQEALKERPLSVAKALEVEIDNFDRKNCWKPVLERDLSPEQRRLVLSQGNTWKEKVDAMGEPIKEKTRIVTHGNFQMQWAIGETDGPVCRAESVFMVLSIAANRGMRLFKVDFVAAYLNTPMPPEVLHRWLLLNKLVSAALVKKDPARWSRYLRHDGRIMVEMMKLNYGYHEASHYWGVVLHEMFIGDGYDCCQSDIRVYTKRVGNDVIHICVVVDDCAGASTSKELADAFVKLCQDTFEECTCDWGPDLTILGMRVQERPELKAIDISQPGYVKELAKRAGVDWTAPTPALPTLFENDPTSPLLNNQTEFLSLNAGAMWPAKRAYPQCLLACSHLAQFYGKATEEHMVKLKRVIAYMLGTLEKDYYLRLSPPSLDIVVAADASYGEHEDGRSHSAGCTGFGNEKGASYFMFFTAVQRLVTKSSAESELVCAATAVDYGIWVQQMMLQMGYGHKVITLLQDNTSTIKFINDGHGTWKRTKHIKVRFFWLKMLIDSGDMVVRWIPSKQLVADILSKPVVGSLFTSLLILLLCWWI